jgi:hypothetical protein
MFLTRLPLSAQRAGTSLLLASLLLTAACGGAKKAAAVEDNALGKEIVEPFTGAAYRSDKDNFRAVGNATSSTNQLSKDKAFQAANARLASLINQTLKSVTERYANEYSAGNAQEANEKFQVMTRTAVNQVLNNIVVKDEKLFKNAAGTYTCYTAVEVNKKELLEKIDSSVSADKKRETNYDRKKFEETFDKEMEKMNQDRTNGN